MYSKLLVLQSLYLKTTGSEKLFTTKPIKNTGLGLITGLAYFYEVRKIENYVIAKYSIFALARKRKNKNILLCAQWKANTNLLPICS